MNTTSRVNENISQPPSSKVNDISIVGFSLLAPNCSSVPDFADALKNGVDLTTSDTRYPSGHLGLPPRQGRISQKDIESFDAGFFGFSHKQAESTDPLLRMLLKVSYEALMDACLDIKSLRGSNTGVYVGHCFSDVGNHLASSANPNKNGYELVNTAHAMASNRLSFFYDFKGPSITIDTACSSSLVALHYAVEALKNGEIDRAVVAGLSLTLNPHSSACFNAFTMLSPTGRCYTFDKRANGYCRSDGVACVILERGKDGYALVTGTGTNSDGFTKEGITYPNAAQQVSLMEKVFNNSQTNPADIIYHEAHGTGTIAGDKEELFALTKIHKHPLIVGSVKSNMGHAEGAAGLMGLIKILLMYEDNVLYPNYDFQESPHDIIRRGAFSVLTSSRSWTPGPCTISGFGFGGSNAFAVLVPPRHKTSQITMHTLPAPSNSLPFSSSIYCENARNTHSKYYAIQRRLGNHVNFKFSQLDNKWTNFSPLVFVLDGQGSQWVGMGKDLMKSSLVFRKTMERLENETDIPLVRYYKEGTMWMSKDISAIGIVSFQIGILAMLRELGVYPDIFLGHSLGELACSYLAGFATEAEVLRFAQARSNLVSKLDPDYRLDVYKDIPEDGFDFTVNSKTTNETIEGNKSCLPSEYLVYPSLKTSTGYVKKNQVSDAVHPDVDKSFDMRGKMIVVGCTAEEVNKAISILELKETRIACYNAPRGQTVSGAAHEVDKLLDYLKAKKQDLFVRELPTDNIAYHGKFLGEVFYSWLEKEFGIVKSYPLPSSWISTSRNNTFGTKYLVENVCCPVYFREAIEALPSGATVVEIGPASGILAQVRRCRSDLHQIGLVERNEMTKFEAWENKLKKWSASEHNGRVGIVSDQKVSKKKLHYTQRYPKLWDPRALFPVPGWRDFEMHRRGNVSVISFDLTKSPWSSIKDHIIKGQILFPAAGFVYALWSARDFEKDTEILNFQIHSPLLISEATQAVQLRLHKAGQSCELWDEESSIRYASAEVKVTDFSFKTLLKCKENFDGNVISGKEFYADRRRLGYQYGPRYQLLEQLSDDFGLLCCHPDDWISYIDNVLQLRLMTTLAFAYPVGFDRVVIKSDSLNEVPLWIQRRGIDSFGNTSLLIEGVRLDYFPNTVEPAPIYHETFFEYSKNTDAYFDPVVLAAVLAKESLTFRVEEPLVCPYLQAVVDSLVKNNLTKQDQDTQLVVLSDSCATERCDLLVTSDSNIPKRTHVLIAQWGLLKLFRFNSTSNLPTATNWQGAAKMDKSFIWHEPGSSGAVSSLEMETRGRIKAISYEGDKNLQLVGLEKGMRHNHLLKNGKHGTWIDIPHNCSGTFHPSNHARLEIRSPGNLDSLEWASIEPEYYQVQISVAALNFRDVMRAMGKLKEDDLSLGLEFSGLDKATKKRVFGVAKNSLGTECTPLYKYPIPNHLTDEQAATIPVVYLTVYYALFVKAKMKAGQSVLIHAGTGGIGIAAITVAKKRGLNIFTTCSSSKRQFLRDTFGLSESQIGDSRSEAFVDTVLAGTHGRGVDVVLNQLAGPLQIASLRCLASNGHFCEIGKYDVMQGSKLSQKSFERNISFHCIDLLPLLSDTSNKPLWDKLLSEGFSSGEICPLPFKAFDAEHIVNAFRVMSQGKHKGKVVINGMRSQNFFTRNAFKIPQEETHLITGGLGGLGLSLAYRLARQGCRELILVSRQGITKGLQQRKINEIENMGCTVQILSTDVLKLDAASLISQPSRIWHFATVYQDALLSEMSDALWKSSLKAKVEGYRHLRQCWSTVPIVVSSSVVAYFGNGMQTSYATANAILDAKARCDPNTISVRFGPLDNVGFITQSENNHRLFDRLPFKVLRIDDVLESMLHIVSQHRSGVFGVYELKDRRTDLTPSRKVVEDGVGYSLEQAQSFIAGILGGSPEQYLPTMQLKSAGLDSLSTMEFVNHIQDKSGNDTFKPSDLDETFTVQNMVDVIKKSCEGFHMPATTSLNDKKIPGKSDSVDTDSMMSEGISSIGILAESVSFDQNKDLEDVKLNTQSRAHLLCLRAVSLQKCLRERRSLAIALILATCYWIVTTSLFSKRAKQIFAIASITFNFCCWIHVAAYWALQHGKIKIAGSATTFAHYFLGTSTSIVYFLLYIIDVEIFRNNWSAIYFGKYASDIVAILWNWESLHPDFRFFYSVHHVISFTITGTWALVDGVWYNYIVLGVFLWLSAEIWQYSLNLCRRIWNPILPKLRSVQWLVFWLERAHRIAAYVSPVLINSFELSAFGKFIFLSGVFNDIFDIVFQLKSLRVETDNCTEQRSGPSAAKGKPFGGMISMIRSLLQRQQTCENTAKPAEIFIDEEMGIASTHS